MRECLQNIILAYALGERLLHNNFKDAVSDVFAKVLFVTLDSEVTSPEAGVVSFAYENTTVGSKLRQLLVQRVCASLQFNFSPQDDPNFLYDSVHHLFGKKSTMQSIVRAVANCRFHEHTPGEKIAIARDISWEKSSCSKHRCSAQLLASIRSDLVGRETGRWNLLLGHLGTPVR